MSSTFELLIGLEIHVGFACRFRICFCLIGPYRILTFWLTVGPAFMFIIIILFSGRYRMVSELTRLEYLGTMGVAWAYEVSRCVFDRMRIYFKIPACLMTSSHVFVTMYLYVTYLVVFIDMLDVPKFLGIVARCVSSKFIQWLRCLLNAMYI